MQITFSRRDISSYLEDLDTPIGTTVNLAIAVLVLLSSAIFIAETFPISLEVRGFLDTIDSIAVIVFAIEYVLRLWCAEKKLAYLFSFYALVDLIAILPSLWGFVDTSFIRVFRWFRILRLIRLVHGTAFLDRVGSEDTIILSRITFTIFAIIFVYSGLIYQVEHAANPERFQNFFDAAYFAVVTMTTVGFGDITPASRGGRLLTVMMILTGITLIPWQLGDLIKQALKTAHKLDLTCHGCGLTSHDGDAVYCKICGTKLEI